MSSFEGNESEWFGTGWNIGKSWQNEGYVESATLLDNFFAGLVFIPGLLISVLCQPELDFWELQSTGSHCLLFLLSFRHQWHQWHQHLGLQIWYSHAPGLSPKRLEGFEGCGRAGFLARAGCRVHAILGKFHICRWSPRFGSRALMVFRFDA